MFNLLKEDYSSSCVKTAKAAGCGVTGSNTKTSSTSSNSNTVDGGNLAPPYVPKVLGTTVV